MPDGPVPPAGDDHRSPQGEGPDVGPPAASDPTDKVPVLGDAPLDDATEKVPLYPPPDPASTSTRSARLKPREARISKLAVESEMASADAVRECEDAVKQHRAMGEDTSLELALVRRGILTDSQLKILLGAMNKGGSDLTHVGPYEVEAKIGQGGMGAVYRARHETLGRIVALKALPEELASDPEITARFIRESQTAVKIEHENVVHVYDAGEADGTFFIAMEYVDGPSLEDEIANRKKIPQEEALAMAIHIARALDVAEKAGLVHRDIKPGNILFTKDRVAKLADLGLAKQMGASQDTQLTQAGYVMGTPNYISPEQSRGKEVDIRSDLFSFGATLYLAVTGEFPYKGDDAVSLIMARFTSPPKPANEVAPDVSDDFARVLAELMAVDKKNRYPSPAVLIHDLELIAEGKRPDYASGRESLRRRAVEASETRSFKVTSGPVIVRSRHRREALYVGIGVVIVALLVGAALLLPGLQPSTPGTENGDSGRTAGPAPALVAAARELYEQQSAAFAAGDHGAVAKAVESAGDRFADTTFAPKLAALLVKAKAALNEERLREEAAARAELERTRRLADLLKAARDQLRVGDYARAMDLALQAKAIFDSPEVSAVLEAARRLQHVSRASNAERDGNYEDAIRLLGLAFEIEKDDAVSERLAEVTRKRDLHVALDEATGHVAQQSLADASRSWKKASGLVADDSPAEIRSELQRLRVEIRYLEFLDAAQTEDWNVAIAKATLAAAIKPDAAAPKEIIRKARRALGPPKTLSNSLGMELVLVLGGSFPMGSTDGDADERPVGTVTLETYYIGRHEVSNAEYDLFSTAHSAKWGEFSPSARSPAIAVSWHQAAAFCTWLSNKEGVTYRLPTEAEWERAARGTDGRRYPWGSAPVASGDGTWRANHAPAKKKDVWGRDGFKYSSPTGSFPSGASPDGCMDMAGNVWEWCADWYSAAYYADRPDTAPKGPATGEKRVLRGGSFTSSAGVMRSANRYSKPPEFYEANVGFRCVRELDELYRDE